MGLFGRKKEKEEVRCPICGAAMKWNDSMSALDGMICYDCAVKFDEIMPDKRIDTSIDVIRKVLEGDEVDGDTIGIPTVCPVCGRDIPEGETLLQIRDGYICEECERLMRGDYSKEVVILDPRNEEHRKKYSYELRVMEEKRDFSIKKNDEVIADELKDQTIEMIKELVEIEKECQESVLAEWGDEFDNLFQVDESFVYDLGPIKGGVKNSKIFKDKMVVKGTVVKGSFSSEDEAVMITGEHRDTIDILDVIPCEGWPFEREIFSSMGNNTVTAHSYAWMVLDLELEEFEGDIIIAK